MFRVPEAADPADAYRRVPLKMLLEIKELTPTNAAWFGTSEPESPLRALDKCLWLLGAVTPATQLL